MEHINWKRVFSIAGLIILLILLLRGCMFACTAPEGEAERPKPGKERLVIVYDTDSKKNVSMPVETYLERVVAAEMPASFHVEALKAQAVAARTYTYKRMADGGHAHNAQLCTDSTCCQAYDSDADCRKKWGASYEANMKKIRTAVEETAGEVLEYNGALIEALYHAASGGQTEDSENVFAAARPYLRGVESENEVGSSHLQDEERMTRKEFAAAINKKFPKAGLKAASLEKQVTIEDRFESGRVETIRLGKVEATGRELRGALELRSAWFTIEFGKEDVVINTRGYGHGVGMSQSGANGMAQEGKGYREILKHYYTGVEIVNLEEPSTPVPKKA